MTLATYECTECAYQVDATWHDQSRYVYRRADVTVVCEPVGPASEVHPIVDKILERFRLSSPGYRLVERVVVNQPLPGGQRIVHHFGGDSPHVEIALAWAQGDTGWLFRAHGAPELEDRCRQVVESFLTSFEPLEASYE